MSFSLSVKWLIETPHVTRSFLALALLMTSRLSRQLMVACVVARARHFDEPHVAFERDRLGNFRSAGKSKTGGNLSRIHRPIPER